MFKQFLESGAMNVCQIDSCRLGSINEIITVLLIVKPTVNALFLNRLGAENLAFGFQSYSIHSGLDAVRHYGHRSDSRGQGEWDEKL